MDNKNKEFSNSNLIEPIKILCIGHPIIDKYYIIEDKFLDDIKAEKSSMNLVTRKESQDMIEILENRNYKKIKELVAGSALNTALDLAILNKREKSARKNSKDILEITVFTALASDNLSNYFIKTFNNEGVKVVSISENVKNTAISIICISEDKERTMFSYLGIDEDFSINLSSYIEEAEKNDIIYLEGYFLDVVNFKELENFLQILKNRKKKIIINLSDKGCIERNISKFEILIKNYIDIIFGNALEFAKLGVLGEECSDNSNEDDLKAYFLDKEKLKKSITKYQANLKRRVLGKDNRINDNIEYIVTLGDKGAVFINNNLNIIIYQDIANIDEIIDLTGAGDATVAGCLFSLSELKFSDDISSIKQSLKKGAEVSMEVINRIGGNLTV